VIKHVMSRRELDKMIREFLEAKRRLHECKAL